MIGVFMFKEKEKRPEEKENFYKDKYGESVKKDDTVVVLCGCYAPVIAKGKVVYSSKNTLIVKIGDREEVYKFINRAGVIKV